LALAIRYWFSSALPFRLRCSQRFLGALRDRLTLELGHRRESRARLCAGRLELSRNVAFISALMERKVDFVCCDNPTAIKFTIHILAAAVQAPATVL
jgi:hypothetical protein